MCAQCIGEQLTAQTDAENGAGLFYQTCEESFLLFEPSWLRLIMNVGSTAQYDQERNFGGLDLSHSFMCHYMHRAELSFREPVRDMARGFVTFMLDNMNSSQRFVLKLISIHIM